MASAAAPACLSAWATQLRARVGSAGLTGPSTVDTVRLAQADQRVAPIQSTLCRVRVGRAMLRTVAPAALSDWLLRLAEENPIVAVWQVVLHPEDSNPVTRCGDPPCVSPRLLK